MLNTDQHLQINDIQNKIMLHKNEPITINDTLKPYHTPLPQYHSTDLSPDENNALINENSALWKHINTFNQVIAPQCVQLTLAIMAFNKTKIQLHEKAQGTQDEGMAKAV